MAGRRWGSLVAAVGAALLCAACGSSAGSTESPAASSPAASSARPGSASPSGAAASGSTEPSGGGSAAPSIADPVPVRPALSPPADQTGVGTTWINLSSKGPFGVLQSREVDPDGRVRITWALTTASKLEFCDRYQLCTGGGPVDQPDISWAVVDCQVPAVETPWESDGGTATFTRSGPDTWVDQATGAVRDSSSAGGGAVIESMWNAACNPSVDTYADVRATGDAVAARYGQALVDGCPPSYTLVGVGDSWRVCKSSPSALSDDFAWNIAAAVSGPGEYSDVSSPNGGSYYFSCNEREFIADTGVLTMLRCGEPPTNIVGGGYVMLTNP